MKFDIDYTLGLGGKAKLSFRDEDYDFEIEEITEEIGTSEKYVHVILHGENVEGEDITVSRDGLTTRKELEDEVNAKIEEKIEDNFLKVVEDNFENF